MTFFKITIIVNGRFHAFDYAAELCRRDLLGKLISSMPFTVAKRYGIRRDQYIGLPVFEVVKRFWRFIFKTEVPALLYAKLFTKTALHYLPEDSNVIISFAGYSKEIFESEKLKCVLKILDRGSTHTLTNINLNRIAAEYHKTLWVSNSLEFVNRELLEYDIADKVLVPSSFVTESFIKNGIAQEKIIQIPYAFSSKKFEDIRSISRKRQNAVLFVGHIGPRKGIGVLIEAMKLVRKKVPEAELWLVGTKNRLIKSSVYDYDWIHHFGILRGEMLFEKYQTASVFCLPSFEEGLALVLTEALRFGLPIVATPNSGAADILKTGENGFLVQAGDHIETSERLIEILTNPDRFLIGNEAQESDMTWGRFCDLLLEKIN
jgi:glycosyltransferase involved in cell wall biosynthesis